MNLSLVILHGIVIFQNLNGRNLIKQEFLEFNLELGFSLWQTYSKKN